jgi:Sulfotransferase family
MCSAGTPTRWPLHEGSSIGTLGPFRPARGNRPISRATTVRAAQGDSSHPCRQPVLPERGKNAKIHVSSRVIPGMPAQSITRSGPMISDTHKFIFIHINKTGGTSIEKAFEPDADQRAVDYKHAWVEFYKQTFPERFRTHFKFTFVRNPWDWLVSRYYWSKERQRLFDYSFDEFLRRLKERSRLCERAPWLEDRALKPQLDRLTTRRASSGLCRQIRKPSKRFQFSLLEAADRTENSAARVQDESCSLCRLLRRREPKVRRTTLCERHCDVRLSFLRTSGDPCKGVTCGR